MKRKLTLCESCSNKVVIKFHGDNIRPGTSELDCFYAFTVETSDSRYEENINGAALQETHIAYVIVDECSFYNKTMGFIKKRKTKKDDDSDYGISKSASDDKFANSATFTNIPGALLP